jgi:hypothetical protein
MLMFVVIGRTNYRGDLMKFELQSYHRNVPSDHFIVDMHKVADKLV